MSTLVLRPAVPADADALWLLLAASKGETVGMGLPADGDAVADRCSETEATVVALATGRFRLGPQGRSRMLFVIADGDDVLGVTGCTFKVDYPNVAVGVETDRTGRGLTMHSASAPWTRTELDSSFLGAPARGRGAGTLLSRGRLMFLHLVAPQVPTTLVSHLRGRFDDTGSAPFWGHYGRHFMPQWPTSRHAEQALRDDPTQLAALSEWIHPLTADVLPSIGPVNEASLPAFRLLLREGLQPTGMFDPIDGGPTVVADLADTATARSRRHGRLDPAMTTADGAVDALVCRAAIDSFRVVRTAVGIGDDELVGLPADAADSLGVIGGDLVVAAPLTAHQGEPPHEEARNGG